jgi:hypothetical protein
MDPIPPSDAGSSKTHDVGIGRGKHGNHKGRAPGVTTRRIRERDALMKELGGDPPHVALLKIGRDEKLELPLRTSALAAAAPFFFPKYAPMPSPRFLTDAPDLGRLTDAVSAVAFVGSVVESARTGKLDAEWTRLFLDAADVFVRLHDKVKIETEIEHIRELRVVAE